MIGCSLLWLSLLVSGDVREKYIEEIKSLQLSSTSISKNCVMYTILSNVTKFFQGRLAIYELMAEESVINYWEKYGNIAFDNGQKAVLTSCLLKNPDTANSPTSPSGRAGV